VFLAIIPTCSRVLKQKYADTIVIAIQDCQLRSINDAIYQSRNGDTKLLIKGTRGCTLYSVHVFGNLAYLYRQLLAISSIKPISSTNLTAAEANAKVFEAIS